ncbi:MAG: thioredoxin family protein [Planctomycetota bacterium]
MNLFDKFQQGLTYNDFLGRYGSDVHKERWKAFHATVKLTPAQTELLGSFTREMNVLCMAGAWCGDCVNQCPIFDCFAAASPVFKLRFVDRDEHADLQSLLRVNGGNRVPVVMIFSEDGEEVARFGDRTISKYRQLMKDQTGPNCPTGITIGADPLTAQVTQDWLDIFERAQWILRLSSRLRQKHND